MSVYLKFAHPKRVLVVVLKFVYRESVFHLLGVQAVAPKYAHRESAHPVFVRQVHVRAVKISETWVRTFAVRSQCHRIRLQLPMRELILQRLPVVKSAASVLKVVLGSV